jgi:hypothetical protein
MRDDSNQGQHNKLKIYNVSNLKGIQPLETSLTFHSLMTAKHPQHTRRTLYVKFITCGISFLDKVLY